MIRETIAFLVAVLGIAAWVGAIMGAVVLGLFLGPAWFAPFLIVALIIAALGLIAFGIL